MMVTTIVMSHRREDDVNVIRQPATIHSKEIPTVLGTNEFDDKNDYDDEQQQKG